MQKFFLYFAYFLDYDEKKELTENKVFDIKRIVKWYSK